MYCCGAGTAADCDAVTEKFSTELELIRLNTGREARVVNAATLMTNYLFYYGGYIGAYLIIGGVDVMGPHIVNISAEGTQMWLPFYSTGSGSLAATSVLETFYQDNMEVI
jgi:20S proteasome subunit beta 2